jgi:two-component system KDP operon response regulator KdpE
LKILIIEDDPEIIEVVSVALSIRWPEVELSIANNGQDGLEILEENRPDLVLLDLGLPDMDGGSVIKQLRLYSNVPVIVITVRNEERDIVKCLEWGADDYVIKPFHQLELIARIQALLRRHHVLEKDQTITRGTWRLDRAKRKLVTENGVVSLSNTETLILGALMMEVDRVLSLQALADIIWGCSIEDSDDAIRVYIRRLRKKLESDPKHPKYVITVPGQGYSLKKQK